MSFLRDFIAAKELLQHITGGRVSLSMDSGTLGLELCCSWLYKGRQYNELQIATHLEIADAIGDLPAKDALRRLIARVRVTMHRLTRPIYKVFLGGPFDGQPIAEEFQDGRQMILRQGLRPSEFNSVLSTQLASCKIHHEMYHLHIINLGPQEYAFFAVDGTKADEVVRRAPEFL